VVAQAVRTDPGRILTELYKEHSADVFRYALHLTGRRADAEDVVQQVFLQAHRHLAGGRELVSPRAWLLTAVKHRAYNLARDRREIPLDQADAPAPPRDPSRDEAAELAEVRGMLWTLPETQHQAFVLRHWNGLSQSEIAHVLETTPAAVESLLVRARAALLRSHESASETCKAVRGHLLEPGGLGSSDRDHLGGCRPCRHAQARLARAANLASSLALVPGTHVADSLAHLVPGFSAHAATTTAAAGTAGAGTAGAAGTGAGAGAGGASVTLGTTAATTAGKLAVAAKATLAALTATAVVSAAPVAGHAVSGLIVHHTAAPAQHAVRNHTAPPVTAPGDPPAQASAPPADGGSSGHTPPGDQGNHAGTGKGGGRPAGTGTGKPTDPGSGKPTSTSGGNGKAPGPGGNGKAPAKPAGGNGKGAGKPTGAGGGKPVNTGGGKPVNTGGGKPVNTGGGKPDGAGGPGNGTAGGTGSAGTGGKPAGAGGGKP
jgi:RNA polymerase sigma factor (sigma-70 family)